MSADRTLTRIAFASLLVLLALELVLRYDTWIRQIALAITNVAAIILLVVFGRQLARRGVGLSWPVVWFATLAVWFDAAGNFAHLYVNVEWWDKLAHAVGSAAVALAILTLLRALQQRGRIQMGRLLLGVYAISITTTLSALYEISEYIGDAVYPTNRVTGLFDTSDDLLWNFLAAVLVVWFGLWLRRRQKKPSQSGASE